MPRGFLIALEGVDGSGKTTQAELLAASLEKGGRKVVRPGNPATARPVSESFPYLRPVAASSANFKGPRFRRLDCQ